MSTFMKRAGKLLAICAVVSLLAAAFPAQAVDAAPGRPMVMNGTVYTARGTKIRGMNMGVYNLSGEPGMVPTLDSIRQIAENGMNCVKIAIFGPDSGPGWIYNPEGETYQNNLRFADMIVDWAEQVGIYAMICLQTQGDPIEPEFVYGFWRIFAPRYADRAHVFFDLTNEMSVYPEGDTTRIHTPTLQARAYELVRELAPDTLCVLWSFSHLIDMDSTLRVLRETEAQVTGGIPWTNEVVGVHGYEGTNGYDPANDWVYLEVFRVELRKLRAVGYPLMNTEVPNMQSGYQGALDLTNYPNAQMLRVLEEEGIAWTCSLDIAWIQEPSIWRGNIEGGYLTWTPDFGDWPVPEAINPFEPQSALAAASQAYEAYESMGEAADLSDMGNTQINMIPCYFVNPNSALRYGPVNFGTLEPMAIQIRGRCFVGGAAVIVHEGGAEGPVLCEIPLHYSAGKNTTYTAYLARAISGVRDITFTFRDADGENSWALMYFIDWQFLLPPTQSRAVHTDIYAGAVPAVNYNFRQGPVVRRASSDAGASTEMGRTLQLEGIVDGSKILFDRVAFTPGGITLRVRAKPLQGGRIDIYANRGMEIKPWTYWTFPLGSCEIRGTEGEWAEFICEIDPAAMDTVMYHQFQLNVIDLLLVFSGDDGAEQDAELFQISEFMFEQHGL